MSNLIILLKYPRLILENGQIDKVIITVVIVTVLLFASTFFRTIRMSFTTLFDRVVLIQSSRQHFLVLTQLAVFEIVRCRVRNVLDWLRWVKFLRHDVERVPYLHVVTLFEGVELVVVGTAICIDLGLLVRSKNSSHWPFAIYETTVSNIQKLWSPTTWTSKNAIGHIFLQLEDVVTSVDYD